MKHVKIIAGILVLAAVLGGAYFFAAAKRGLASADRIAGAWTLESHNGQAVNGSISFQNDGIFSAQICNSYGGNYEINSGHLKFSKVAGTLMACIDKNLTSAEDAFRKFTENGATAKIAGGKLEIAGAGDVLVFGK